MSQVGIGDRLKQVSAATDHKGNVLSLNTEPDFCCQFVVQLLHCWFHPDCRPAQWAATLRPAIRDHDLRFDLNVSVVANPRKSLRDVNFVLGVADSKLLNKPSE